MAVKRKTTRRKATTKKKAVSRKSPAKRKTAGKRKTAKKAAPKKAKTAKKTTAKRKTTKRKAAKKTTRKKTAKKAAPKKAKTAKKARRKSGKASGLAKLRYAVSEALGAIVGHESLSRPEIVKKLWAYIKSHNLQDSVNKRMIIPDDKLAKVVGSKPVDMMKLASHISKHVK